MGIDFWSLLTLLPMEEMLSAQYEKTCEYFHILECHWQSLGYIAFEGLKKYWGTHPCPPSAGRSLILMEVFNLLGSSLPAGQSFNLDILLKYMALYKITYFTIVL